MTDTVAVRHYAVFYKLHRGGKVTVRRVACGANARPSSPAMEDVTCEECKAWGKKNSSIIKAQANYLLRDPVARKETGRAKDVLQQCELNELNLIQTLPLLQEGQS